MVTNVSTGLDCLAQGVGQSPAERKVAGSIPSRGTCLGGGFGPGSGRVWEATDLFPSDIHISLPLFLRPFPSP